MKVYYDKDADLNVIKNLKISIIGFGLELLILLEYGY